MEVKVHANVPLEVDEGRPVGSEVEEELLWERQEVGSLLTFQLVEPLPVRQGHDQVGLEAGEG